MVRTKVFVGNLSFKTREAELAQEFAAAGHVYVFRSYLLHFYCSFRTI